ncbi:type II toxin-antitoxin system Phd/YefM family antitoxin [Plectonema cf. radiosum LEGE 06105]|uniref:Type II toxin-antitoxin system Phd/YefM family antitoxin n=1 Tax=Plectonema cf. radiosum LEGE 06105 TaxID=945769 RepID=A0A8J7FK46_9CYAN|nr:type II toxin-antitoxin system Phd/YefM family antitoxin [Plectonema radiosum]MBE9215246.1 type II toxin-antitoxin system Phd/YefM family antitoxin [Plectonema cf. radiosum LEGE 06105]
MIYNKQILLLLTKVDEARETGSEIIITRDGVAVARVVSCQIESLSKANYLLRGMPIEIPADFDEPMPELWEALSE